MDRRLHASERATRSQDTPSRWMNGQIDVEMRLSRSMNGHFDVGIRFSCSMNEQLDVGMRLHAG
jgi:hypothetical protein